MDRGQVRILCIGDSHTFGVYLPREQSYPCQLERMLNHDAQASRFAVINAGYPGRNTATILRLLPQLLEQYRPRAVLLLAGLNNRWNTVDRDAILAPPRGPIAAAQQFIAARSRLVKL
ncbi:MAG: GDSL-type esterase/lipase family protein, partial [Planctomycetota bacterium]